jgi:glycosyltransferase involved in cell wall biosynthesis
MESICVNPEVTPMTERESTNMLVSVVIPVYNEADTINELLGRLRGAPFEKEIIIVDDCSTDGTGDILKAEQGIVLLRHDRNRGKGSAIRTGIQYATGDIIIIQDADLEYDPNEIPLVVDPIRRGEAEIVSCSEGSCMTRRHATRPSGATC